MQIEVSHRGSGDKSPTESWAQLMKGGAHPSPFGALKIIKVSHSLIAVVAVWIRVPLYLGHS